MAQPIEIVIRKTQETSTQRQENIKKPSSDTSFTQKAVNAALVNAGRQVASYAFTQFGNLTGNTVAQKEINNLLTIASYVGEVLAAGYVGLAVVGTQLGLGALSNAKEVRDANIQSQLLYQRSGNATIDGGRGTND